MTIQPSSETPQEPPDLLAAIDLGSNSFHMVVARVVQGEIRIMEKLGEKVQLASGLGTDNLITEAAQQRALECLQRFAERIQGMPPNAVQIVGTNTLRLARNTREFIRRAEAVIGYPIEVINGREEARLVYLGVAHTLSDDVGRRLVVDIGGGSTEFIIGERFETRALESMHMGCVSFRDRFFPDGEITKGRFDRAITQASMELQVIQKAYRSLGWTSCVGSSGTIKAVSQVVYNHALSNTGITWEALMEIKRRVLELGHCDQLDKLGLRKERAYIFPSGLAILIAAFEVLRIERMGFSEGALREGVLYDMIGRIKHEDVRERTVNAMAERYCVDQSHAQAVEATALHAYNQVAKDWGIAKSIYADLLRWACRMHEVGLAISHTQFHKHGAYVIRYSDLPGFTRQAQQALSVLIRAHRRKLSDLIFAEYSTEEAEPLKKLAILLRLAVLLQHTRSGEIPPLKISVSKKKIHLQFEPGWLDVHTLTQADLEAEADYLTKLGYHLSFV